MLRLASDADVSGGVIRGLLRRRADLDLVRAQDQLPNGPPDPKVLEWAAAQNPVLISNDRQTMIGYARKRIAAGESMPGLISTTGEQSIGSTIHDILLIAECLSEADIQADGIVFLPL